MVLYCNIYRAARFPTEEDPCDQIEGDHVSSVQGAQGMFVGDTGTQFPRAAWTATAVPRPHRTRQGIVLSLTNIR